ncbi:hypothetical protein CDD83_1802 [Cordyceps sp. RAO-2017]|nr:hypothetical protein CDD83_1802 [Cordyceps sp. RAO-2017]
MFGILESVTVPHSTVYASCEDLMRDLNGRAEKEGYKIVKARSHRSAPGGPFIRCDLVCERGGRPYRCQATKHKTSTKKTDCPWKAKAVDRKLVGGWTLTIICDHHNHEPGTPEPPTPSEASEAEIDDEDDGPRPDAETSVALQVAGVSDSVLRLSGDTFHRFKNEYRKMSQPERMGILAQMQLRIAAIYALQNEDMQRQKRQEAKDKRHQEIEESRMRQEAGGLRPAKRIRAQPRPPNQENVGGAMPGAPTIQEPRFQPIAPAPAPTPNAPTIIQHQVRAAPAKRMRGGRPSAVQQRAQQQAQQTPQQQPQPLVQPLVQALAQQTPQQTSQPSTTQSVQSADSTSS